jgi:hypothetical protein
MNNTNTLAIVAVLMAATLVVGTFATVATTTQSALAYTKKPLQDDNKKTRNNNGSGNGNGNTVTTEECKNRGSASGFDTALDQECENLICTHPGNNATCVQEGAVTSPTSTTGQPPTPEPITTTLRIIKKVVCLPTDPNCSLSGCSIFLAASIPPNPPNIQIFPCQSALGNGVVFTLQPGDNFNVPEGFTVPPFFDVIRSDDCEGTIAAGQHLTCTITNTETSATR